MADPITVSMAVAALIGAATTNVASEVGPTTGELRGKWEEVYVKTFFNEISLLSSGKTIRWETLESMTAEEFGSYVSELLTRFSADTMSTLHHSAQAAAWASMTYHAPSVGIKAVGRGIGNVFGFGKEKD